MTKQEARRLEWASRIADYRASGLTMSAWCAAHHITKDQLKYWLYKRKESSTPSKSSSHNGWVSISVADLAPTVTSTSLVVQIGQARIEIQSDFDPRLLRKIVHALEMPC